MTIGYEKKLDDLCQHLLDWLRSTDVSVKALSELSENRINRQTFYYLLDEKRTPNPTLSTLLAIAKARDMVYEITGE